MPETELTALYALENSIDSFAPGHYARVFDAVDRRNDRRCAFKVMRAEHLTRDGQPRWEANAFINEADLLTRMAVSPHVVRLYDCGYVASEEERPRAGQIISFGGDVEAFRAASLDYAALRWRPYLALEPLPRGENLLYLMKPNTPGTRWRLPTEEGLDLALQFADVLLTAHRQRIIYLDHKLEHVYWDGTTLRIIDWNSSKLVTPTSESSGVLAGEVQADLHNLCVGIFYSIFTGLSPQKGTLMPQPADQTEVEGRYSDVNHLDFGSEPTLSAPLQAILESGARRQLANADQLIAGLSRVATIYGWDAGADGVRSHVRAGLRRLRQGQDAIREARDMLREAAILEGVDEDVDGELRRLLARINDMLNSRVIP